MQFAKRNDVVFARGIVRIETERVRICDQMNIAVTKFSVRSGHMKAPIELLANGVHENRILRFRKLIHPFGPQRDGESDEEHGFDQDDRKLEVRRDSTLNSLIIGFGMSAFAESKQKKRKIGGPADKKRTHEPVAEFDDVIDLIAVLGCVRRHSEKFVDDAEIKHTCRGPRRSVPDAAPAGCGPPAPKEKL